MGPGAEPMVGHTNVDFSLHTVLSPPCEMHQTQTFVHLTILLLPRAHCAPRPVKSIGVTIRSKIQSQIPHRERIRRGSENSSKSPSICPKSEMPVCSRLQRGRFTYRDSHA